MPFPSIGLLKLFIAPKCAPKLWVGLVGWKYFELVTVIEELGLGAVGKEECCW